MDVRLLVRGEAEFGGEAVEVLEGLRGHVVKVDKMHRGVDEGEEEGGARAYLEERILFKDAYMSIGGVYANQELKKSRKETSVSDLQFDRRSTDFRCHECNSDKTKRERLQGVTFLCSFHLHART